MTFKDFNLHESLHMGLQDSGFTEPTPIQEQSIPLVLEGRDILGAAQTGTGKTGAFIIPILQKILTGERDGTQALILSPTRELAQQIDEQIFALGYHTGLTSASVIGGEDFSRQAKAIRAGVDLIVATPGRLIDQMKVLDIDFSNLNYLVLDEADRMLDMGFLPDVSHIIGKLPTERQTLLFSATLAKDIQKFSSDIMNDPALIEIEVSTPAESVDQRAYLIDGREKLKVVQNLLEDLEWTSCIIFTATKKGTDKLERLLNKRGINAGSIHGDRDQKERTNALNDFKSGKSPVIVATDVLARGIDIANVSVIINYDVPKAVDDYIHRIGRTGRYDKKGIAITLVSKRDNSYFDAIKSKVGDEVQVFKGYDSNQKPESNKQEVQTEKKTEKQTSEKKQSTVASEPDFTKANTILFNTDNGKEGKIVIELKNKADKPEKQEQEKEPAKTVEKTSKPKKPSVEVKLKKKSEKSDRSTSKKKSENPRRPKMKVKTIDKAAERNSKSRKPAKGVWGLIKSFLPKF